MLNGSDSGFRCDSGKNIREEGRRMPLISRSIESSLELCDERLYRDVQEDEKDPRGNLNMAR